VPDRGKVLTAEDLSKLEKWGRYQDTGGGIPSRTLPGSGGKGAFFTRGSGHNLNAVYTEDSAEYKAVLDRIALKFKTAATAVPKPEFVGTGSADIGIIALGGTRGAVLESIARLKDQGIAADFMRIRGFPFGAEVLEFIEKHERVFVVEQNRDAQLKSMITIELSVDPNRLTSILDFAGLPLTAKVVVEAVASTMAAVS
jgi:2-oxoglutarate ferredoxin oxidoreductase subunit alpha